MEVNSGVLSEFIEGGAKTDDVNDKTITSDMINNIAIAAYEKKQGASGHHIRSMNTFYDKGIKSIIVDIFRAEIISAKYPRDQTEEDRDIKEISFSLRFKDAWVEKPRKSSQDNIRGQDILTPNSARIEDLNYSGQIFVKAHLDVSITRANGAKENVEVDIDDPENPWQIGEIPIMTMSNKCHLHGADHQQLKEMQEDPHSIGGVFILGGKEYAINSLENLLNNWPHVYRRRDDKKDKELSRLTFLSKPGDGFENSSYITIKYLRNGEIVLQPVVKDGDKDLKVNIPFYLIFRAFGMTSDREIIDNIVCGIDVIDDVKKNMLNVLENALRLPSQSDADFASLHTNKNQNDILDVIAQKIDRVASSTNYKKDPNAIKYISKRIRHQLDGMIFPHIGMNEESRIRKLRFFADLIHILFLVDQGIIDSTDRDSYVNKRVHPAGVSLSKTFKQQFNLVDINAIRNSVRKHFENEPWKDASRVETLKLVVRKATDPKALDKGMRQAITSGDDTIRLQRHDVANRISTQIVQHKNDVNVKSTLSNITTHGGKQMAKASDRAIDVRRVHSTYQSIIGPNQSADGGDPVGLNKQLTIGATIWEASSSAELKEMILSDESVIPEDKITDPTEKFVRKLVSIYVNGDHIAFCENANEFAFKYRTLRRKAVIDRYATIVVSAIERKVFIWVDLGRVITPFIIVYNNLEEYVREYKSGNKKAQFKQWTKLKNHHFRDLRSGKIKMNDLIADGIIEYLAPDEIENAYVCMNYSKFIDDEFNQLNQYTHIDIEINMFGLVELSAPNLDHIPGDRITMFTNQKKQTCGWFALNFPYRMEKNSAFQYFCHLPIVYSFSNNFTYPNSQNSIIAYMCYGGYNIEDSIIINRSSSARGHFAVSFSTYESTKFEQNETLAIPSSANTRDIKNTEGTYEHLDSSGIVKVGTVVKKGYVLISKIAPLIPPNEKYQFTDKSIIYKSDDPSVIEAVIVGHNDAGEKIVKVKMRSYRPIRIGDKVSSHAGNKSIIALELDECVMPYTDTGLIPDFILNPHAVPTRMVIGQIIEAVQANLAVKKGCLIDGSPYRRIDVKEMIKELESYGIKDGGYRRLFNGKNGEWFDTLIFTAPGAYQRLQKFVIDESRYRNSGPTQALTRQPYRGKAHDGSLRIGEYEVWVYTAHGSMTALNEKLYTHSDGTNIFICKSCSGRAYVNEKDNIARCRKCTSKAEIVRVPSSWCSNLLTNTIESMGMSVKFDVEPTYTIE